MICKCQICGKEFETKHRTIVCPECKIGKCVICGKEFTRLSPYTQKTCCSKCRGEYRKQSGLSKEIAKKSVATKLKKYGTTDASLISKPGKKICPLCGKEFQPNTFRQVYCKGPHYGNCPVCGKRVLIKDISVGPVACSEECRMARINATCLEKYGNKDAVNSDHARALAKQTSLRNWGTEHPSQSKEFQAKVRKSMLERFGAEYVMQSPILRAKIEKTNLERYGVKVPSSNDAVKEKIKQTHEQRYGGI